MREAEAMTLFEYKLRMEAEGLKNLDKERDMHWMAYLNLNVQKTEVRGKKTYSAYPTFKHFFDYDKIKEEMYGTNDIKKEVKENKKNNIKNLILLANKEGG